MLPLSAPFFRFFNSLFHSFEMSFIDEYSALRNDYLLLLRPASLASTAHRQRHIGRQNYGFLLWMNVWLPLDCTFYNKNFNSLFHSSFEIPSNRIFWLYGDRTMTAIIFSAKNNASENPKFAQSAPTLCPIAQKRATTRKRDQPYRILHKIWHLLTLVLG